MKQNLEEIYYQILNSEEIKATYQEVEEYEISHGGWGFHNFVHVKNVSEIVARILNDLGFNQDFITKAQIACLLHDTGVTKGKEGHPYRSYQYAKQYFSNHQIDFEDLDLVLEAIRIHSDGFETDNMIALALIFADKLDIKKSRITEAGKQVIGNRQYAHIEDIKVNIQNQQLKIEFITDGDLDIEETNEFYFTKKVFHAIQAFANKLNLKYEVWLDEQPWNMN